MKHYLSYGGGIDDLKIVDGPAPEPGPGEVQLRMKAMCINYRDYLVSGGAYPAPRKDELIPLSDGVGVVEAVGEGVTDLAIGDRVCPLFFQNWMAGRRPNNSVFTALGAYVDGVAREVAVFPAQGVIKVPDHLSDLEAATLPCAGLTAWNTLMHTGGLMAGDTVLCLGTGGVSIYALQFAKAAGARVVITSSSDEKLEQAKALGADITINYTAEPEWGKKVRKLTGGVDHVVEIGGGTLLQSLQAIRIGGFIGIIGIVGGGDVPLPIGAIMGMSARVQGISVGSREMFQHMAQAIEISGLKPVIGAEKPFDDLQGAFRLMQSAQHFGKIALPVG